MTVLTKALLGVQRAREMRHPKETAGWHSWQNRREFEVGQNRDCHCPPYGPAYDIKHNSFVYEEAPLPSIGPSAVVKEEAEN